MPTPSALGPESHEEVNPTADGRDDPFDLLRASLSVHHDEDAKSSPPERLKSGVEGSAGLCPADLRSRTIRR
jgi:hypothetical protein